MSTRDWGRYLNDSFGALWEINFCGFHGGWGWSEFGTSDDTTPQRHPAVLFQRPNSYDLLFHIWINEETHHPRSVNWDDNLARSDQPVWQPRLRQSSGLDLYFGILLAQPRETWHLHHVEHEGGAGLLITWGRWEIVLTQKVDKTR